MRCKKKAKRSRDNKEGRRKLFSASVAQAPSSSAAVSRFVLSYAHAPSGDAHAFMHGQDVETE